MNRAEARIKKFQNSVSQLGGYNCLSNCPSNFFKSSKMINDEMKMAMNTGRKNKNKNKNRK